MTEASFEIGPGHRGAMRGKKIYDKGKGTTNPHEKDAFLKRTGPQLPLAKGKKSLETAGYEPETEGEQLDEFMGGIIKGMKGNSVRLPDRASNLVVVILLVLKMMLTSAGGGLTFTNNARLLARQVRPSILEAWFLHLTNLLMQQKPAGPKPNPIQANRPGFNTKGISTSSAGTSVPGGTSDATAVAQAVKE